MRFSNLFLFIILMTINPLFSTTYKLTHPKQIPWPGFFSVFNAVLGALEFYENSLNDNGFIVDFQKAGFFYDAKHGTNWWEYYFEPINIGTLDNDIIEFKEYKKIIFSFFAQLKMERKKGHQLITKYIKVKPHIQKKVDAFIQEHFDGAPIIGIHYRGTDKSLEAPLVKFETVGVFISNELEQNKIAKIFVATDDENFLTYMYKTFPGKIIALNAIRSKNGNPIHTDTNQDPYQKGEDALLDCLLLSKCSKLYKTASNLSDASIKFNPTIPVVNISQHFTEQTRYNKYNFFKAFNTILLLLDTYEKNKNKGFTAHLPTKDANWWEFHFNPLSVGNPHPELRLNDTDLTIFGFSGIYEMDPKRACELISKYIEIKPHILNKIEEFNEKIKNSFTVSVFYMEDKENNYRQYNEIILKTHKILKDAPADNKILLISNDSQFLTLMNKEFTNLLNPINPAWTMLDGETDLLFCLMMARTQCIIGSQSVYLRVASQFNPEIPVFTIGEFWLEN